MVADGRIFSRNSARRSARAADLKFLHHLQQTRLGTSNRKGHENHRVASAPLFPKFVSECAEVYHELRKRGTRAADLKFLHHLQQTRLGTSNRKRHENHRVASAPLFPKFVSECAEVYHELRKRGTRASPLAAPPFWPRSGIAPALIEKARKDQR